jgi:hypothetical protein
MQPLCRHILASGHQCAGVALRGRNFCFHHNHLHIEKRSSSLRSQITLQPRTQTYDLGTIPVPESPEPVSRLPITLEFPEDPASILTNIYRVTSLLLAGHIDRPTANSVTYGMQVCLSALHGKPLIEPVRTPQSRTRSQSPSSSEDDDSETTYSDPSTPSAPVLRSVSRVILTPEGDEIAPPVEILEDNEAEPIHHKGCPCLLCAEKYRNQPPEEHHPDCQCGLCEEQETGLSEQGSEQPDQRSAIDNGDVEGPAVANQDQASAEGAPSFRALCERVGTESPDTAASSLAQPTGPATCRRLRPRIARAAALLSGSTSRDPLNRPWSVAEHTFGDAVRRHEAQYAARAAAALAVGIEPPPYQPFITGLIRPGTPEWEEEQQMQQHSSEYWAEHFRKQIAERPDIQPGVPTDRSSSVGWKQYLDEEQQTAEPSATTEY